MKYVVTGSLGHISKPLTKALVSTGHDVHVITSNNDRVKEIEDLGAHALVGNIEDALFVENSFKGADALYLMLPPNYAAPVLRDFQKKVTANYIKAIKVNNIKYAVALSSIGAHLGTGAGPIDGVAHLEQELNKIDGLNVKSLRPSYFYLNLLALAPMVKHLNLMGSNFGGDEKLVLTDTSDIADAAIEELSTLSFTGKSHRYISSDEKLTSEIAQIFSKAIDKPGTPWVVFSDEQAKAGMIQAGLSEDLADNYTIMGKAIREGKVQEDYWKHQPQSLGKVKLDQFAKTFAAVFNNN